MASPHVVCPAAYATSSRGSVESRAMFPMAGVRREQFHDVREALPCGEVRGGVAMLQRVDRHISHAIQCNP